MNEMPEPIIPINIFRTEKKFEIFHEGETIFKQGDEGDCMYAVVDGDVDLIINDSVVETVIPGGIFGEMAILDFQPRSATAVAKTESKVTRIDKRKFSFLVQESPFFALQVMKIMAVRIRNMNERLN